MKQTILFLITLMYITNNLIGQCETWNNYPDGEQEAKRQHVLYRDKIKEKKYDEAFPIWSNLFKYVKIPTPAKTTHYMDGVELCLYFAKKDTNKQQWIDKLINLYDDNAKCNGEDATNRAYQGYYMYSNGYDMLKTYKVFEYSLTIKSDSPPPLSLIYMTIIAINQYRLKNDSFNVNYMNNLYDRFKKIVDNNQQSKDVKLYNKYWIDIDKMYFQISEVFDCEYITKKYTDISNLNNIDTLKIISKTLSDKCGKDNILYKEVWEKYKSLYTQNEIIKQNEIINSDTSSVYSKIQSLRNLSELDSINKEIYKTKINTLIPQLTNSSKEWIDSFTIATELYRYAYDLYKNNNYSSAREYCKISTKFKPTWGDPYILIGIMYASSGNVCNPSTSGKGFDSQIFVWVAIDEWIKAKSIDPSITNKANELINKYSSFMPTKVELLQRQIPLGSTFTVGCWIQQNTIVRGI